MSTSAQTVRFLSQCTAVVFGVCAILCAVLVERPLRGETRNAEQAQSNQQLPPKTRDMVLIPAGEFLMGTSVEQAQQLAARYDVDPSLFLTESPQRKVKLKPFLIDRYPVTNAQYRAFLDATDYKPWRPHRLIKGREQHPVTHVAWPDAVAYAHWAGLRLPTQEEWEKAARGTDGRTYPWGDEWRDVATRTDDRNSPRTRANTTPVGAFPAGASPYNVLDMCGNVAEWTATRMPPDTIGNTGFWVIKGASGVNSQRYNFRCAARNFSAHEYRAQSYLGFRCVKDIFPRSPLAPIPPAAGPRAALYGKECIRVGFQQGQHTGVIHVPYFPDATFLLNVPEVAGCAELGSNRGGPTQWTAHDDGSCQYTFVLPAKTEYHVKLVPGLDHVDLTIRIRNLTDQSFTKVFTNTCFNSYGAPYFFDPERARSFGWTDQGVTSLLKIPFATRSSPGETLYGSWLVTARATGEAKQSRQLRPPFLFVRSRDSDWVIAQAWDTANRLESNAHYTCLHTLPVWPDIPAGQARSKTGKLYFLQGGPETLMARWKSDFGK